jgi:hypothetical protein
MSAERDGPVIMLIARGSPAPCGVHVPVC